MYSNLTDTGIQYKNLGFLGFPTYCIGEDGSVWSAAKVWKKGKWRKLSTPYWGNYRIITLCYQMHSQMFRLSCLMLLAFKGPRPEGMLGCHNDGDTDNNWITNLRWDTPSENCRDMRKHGTAPIGVNNPRAKVTEDDVRKMREMYETGNYSQSKLGEIFGLDQTTVSGIIMRVSWKNVK